MDEKLNPREAFRKKLVHASMRRGHAVWHAVYHEEAGENASRWKPLKPEKDKEWITANEGRPFVREVKGVLSVDIAAIQDLDGLPPSRRESGIESATAAIETLEEAVRLGGVKALSNPRLPDAGGKAVHEKFLKLYGGDIKKEVADLDARIESLTGERGGDQMEKEKLLLQRDSVQKQLLEYLDEAFPESERRKDRAYMEGAMEAYGEGV